MNYKKMTIFNNDSIYDNDYTMNYQKTICLMHFNYSKISLIVSSNLKMVTLPSPNNKCINEQILK